LRFFIATAATESITKEKKEEGKEMHEHHHRHQRSHARHQLTEIPPSGAPTNIASSPSIPYTAASAASITVSPSSIPTSEVSPQIASAFTAGTVAEISLVAIAVFLFLLLVARRLARTFRRPFILGVGTSTGSNVSGGGVGGGIQLSSAPTAQTKRMTTTLSDKAEVASKTDFQFADYGRINEKGSFSSVALQSSQPEKGRRDWHDRIVLQKPGIKYAKEPPPGAARAGLKLFQVSGGGGGGGRLDELKRPPPVAGTRSRASTLPRSF